MVSWRVGEMCSDSELIPGVRGPDTRTLFSQFRVIMVTEPTCGRGDTVPRPKMDR